MPGSAPISAASGDAAYRLDGNVALITGASKGIGAAIAVAFAEAGADVALVARNEQDLQRVAATVRETGRNAFVCPTDIADVSLLHELVEAVVRQHGHLDVLVNNAGGAAPRSLMQTTPEVLLDAFHFNVVSAFELTKQATPHLLRARNGTVINVSSRMDRLVARGLLAYGTVKAAMSHMTRLLAAELAPSIRVNGIAPGVVATEALEDALGYVARRQIESATPLGRLASVSDVAYVARWLASPAAAYVSGKVIELDGGAEAPVFPQSEPSLSSPDD